MLDFLIVSFILSASSYAIQHVLMESGMLLYSYYKLLHQLNQKGFPHWILKPMGLCELCFAGQIGFWGYFVFYESWNIPFQLCTALLTLFFYKKLL